MQLATQRTRMSMQGKCKLSLVSSSSNCCNCRLDRCGESPGDVCFLALGEPALTFPRTLEKKLDLLLRRIVHLEYAFENLDTPDQ